MLIRRKEFNNVSKRCTLKLSDLCTKTTISTSVKPCIINIQASPLLYISASHIYQPVFHADGSPLDADDFGADILT